MKKSILIGLVFSLFLSVPAFAGSKTIIAAADPWAPFVDPQHPKEGISLEVIRAAYATQGYTVKMEYVPWARAEKGVTEGKYDILPPTWKTEKRKKVLVFSDSYAANQIKFIKKKDDPFEFNGIKSLNGKVIGTIRSYGYGDAFLNATNFKKDVVSNFETNVKKLVAGRIDLTLEDEIVARVKIAQLNPNLLEKVSFTDNALSENKLYVACGIKNPRHKEIIGAFNKGLAEIKASGEYKKIMESYGIK